MMSSMDVIHQTKTKKTVEKVEKAPKREEIVKEIIETEAVKDK